MKDCKICTDYGYKISRDGYVLCQQHYNEVEDLFHILQVLNPESDKPSPHCLDEPEDEERWEDICYYMDLLKPEEEK